MDDKDAIMTFIEATGLITTLGIATKASGKECPIDFFDLASRMTKATQRAKEVFELMDKDLSIERKEDKNDSGSKNG